MNGGAKMSFETVYCLVKTIKKKYNLTPFQELIVRLLIQDGKTRFAEEYIYRVENGVRKNMEKGQTVFSAFYDYVK